MCEAVVLHSPQMCRMSDSAFRSSSEVRHADLAPSRMLLFAINICSLFFQEPPDSQKRRKGKDSQGRGEASCKSKYFHALCPAQKKQIIYCHYSVKPAAFKSQETDTSPHGCQITLGFLRSSTCPLGLRWKICLHMNLSRT